MDELLVVQAAGAGLGRRRWPLELPEPRAPFTAQQASARLQEGDGAAALLGAVPALAQPESWSDLAYFDVRGVRGPSAGYAEYWDADVGGFSLFDLLANDWIFFAGARWPTAPGRVFCLFELPEAIPETSPAPVYDCAFGIRLYGYGPDTYPADEPEQAHVGFFIDDHPTGELTFEHWSDTALHVRMTPGVYAFEIRQLPESGSFLFQSLTIWQPLIPPQGPAR